MLIIGIAGGIASGKSAVSKQLVELGARHIDADKIGHVVLTHNEVIDSLCKRWGEQILERPTNPITHRTTPTKPEGHLPTRRIDRAVVAKIVFGDTTDQELTFLESVTHPRIRSEINRQVREYRDGGVEAVVLDAALLFKAGWDRLCDYVIFVAVPRQIRLERAFARGWTEDEYDSRTASQTDLEEKLRRSHVVIDNSGTLERTRTQTQEFWNTCVAARHTRNNS